MQAIHHKYLILYFSHNFGPWSQVVGMRFTTLAGATYTATTPGTGLLLPGRSVAGPKVGD